MLSYYSCRRIHLSSALDEVLTASAIRFALPLLRLHPAEGRSAASRSLEARAIPIRLVHLRVHEAHAPRQHFRLVEPLHDGVGHELRASAVGVVGMRRLPEGEVWPAAGRRSVVVDEKRLRLLLQRRLYIRIESREPLVDDVVKHRVLGQDQDPHVWVLRMDRPDQPPEAIDRHLQNLLARKTGSIEAPDGIRLVIVEPSRDQGHVTLARILGDVRQPHDIPTKGAAWTVSALHLLAGDVAIAVVAAIVPTIIRKVPTVPTDLSHACGSEVVEILGVVTGLRLRRVEARLGLRRHRWQFVPEPF
mmetsp:Transcript_114970/g.245508  ORF Transcript_114970/g.245508 Transcript_114970/m.245508 type:complete len:304 (-) Transcript_114970:822-1733(-)